MTESRGGRRRTALVWVVSVVLALVLAPAPPAAAAAPLPDPLYAPDFPDPSLLQVGGTTYAFGTNGRFGNVQVIRSTDLRTWERMPDALPRLPAWAAPNFTWAPAALARGPNAYVLYYTANHRTTGFQCIGRAIATKPEGPYTDELPQPFVCQMDLRGSIDPQPFVAPDGSAVLLYKSEGRVGEPTRIWSQRLAADGRTLVGSAVELTKTAQAWQEPIIEGPAMVYGAGAYWLLFAGNHWETPNYAIGVARCTTPLGPCVQDGSGPLLAATPGSTFTGPGSPDVARSPDGELLLTFHAWTKGREGYPTGARALRAVPLSFTNGRPTVPGSVRRPGGGYRLVATDGGVFSFGTAGFQGSTGDVQLNQPIRTMATTPSGDGYWLAAEDGGMFTFGDAAFFGSTGSMRLNRPIVGMAPTPTGRGYWLVASDGGIFSFGDAGFFGSTGSVRLNRPIVGMAPTASGNGYWLVASDGGIFAFGDATFFGSTGDLRLNSPIVSIVARPWSDGYWLVAADGGVFAFGAAPFLGSTGDLRLNSAIVGAAVTATGDGYWFVAADGGVFTFGAAPFAGSTGGSPLNRPVVEMAA
jgi:hypothetical protein